MKLDRVQEQGACGGVVFCLRHEVPQVFVFIRKEDCHVVQLCRENHGVIHVTLGLLLSVRRILTDILRLKTVQLRQVAKLGLLCLVDGVGPALTVRQHRIMVIFCDVPLIDSLTLGHAILQGDRAKMVEVVVALVGLLKEIPTRRFDLLVLVERWAGQVKFFVVGHALRVLLISSDGSVSSTRRH